VHLSPTTLHRRFRAELGTAPLTWLTAERVDLAGRLIEQGAAPLDLVAHHSGLGTTANLRAQTRRRTGLSPSQYRAQFARGLASGCQGGRDVISSFLTTPQKQGRR
jgi:AraC family transcriptional activator FtrA